jgi:hypothetical protein
MSTISPNIHAVVVISGYMGLAKINVVQNALAEPCLHPATLGSHKANISIKI